MKYKWLNKKNNSKLIIFFNGWGMDENIVNHLAFSNYDVLMFYDYNSLETEFNFNELNSYSQKNLIAWSMGVMIATLFNIDCDTKTAINGTLKPIDDCYGIPHKIYNLTLKNFSPKGAERFMKNMFSENCTIPQVQRTFDNQKSELEALTHYQANENFNFTRIILSSEDKIIPTKNQMHFWGIEPNIKSGHAPFNNFESWRELL